MRYLILLILTLITAPSMADDSDEQYTNASNTIKTIYEILNKRGRTCDIALNRIGIKAALSKYCQPFLDSSKIVNKIIPQCDIVIASIKQKHNQLKDAFIKEYCGARPPSKYKYIAKTFKKIQLMSD
ncbi:MAG: hypothetical protein JKX76_04995 [Colwellia sp.]|nr:hypothetical protein [Colwellia sp.]